MGGTLHARRCRGSVRGMSIALSTLAEYARANPRSQAAHERALTLFPSGLTHDARRQDPFPPSITRAEGAYKWDLDGHRIVDYVTGHGALVAGHSHPAVVEAVRRQAGRGAHLGASSELEADWATRIVELVPSAERVRFTSSGTEATLLALRDQQLPLPAGAVLQSPWADLTLSSSSWDSRRPLDPLVGEHNAPAMADAYLNGVDAKTPLASPVFADLRGLPPLLILVGDHEVLLDDSTALAANAHDAGVDVALEVLDELHHVWPVFAADTTEGRRAVALMEQFIRKHIGS